MRSPLPSAPRAILGLAVLTAAVTFTACSDNSAKVNDPVPGAAAASASPTADVVAFRRFTDATHSTSQIVAAKLDGSQEKVLTSPGAGGLDSSPSWSPDGTRLAFARSVPQAGCGSNCTVKEVFVVSAAGGPATQLTHAPGGAVCSASAPSACDAEP